MARLTLQQRAQIIVAAKKLTPSLGVYLWSPNETAVGHKVPGMWKLCYAVPDWLATTMPCILAFADEDGLWPKEKPSVKDLKDLAEYTAAGGWPDDGKPETAPNQL